MTLEKSTVISRPSSVTRRWWSVTGHSWIGATRARVTVLLAAFLVLASSVAGAAAEEHPVAGMIISVNPAAKTFTASIQAIPGYMQAMTMPFEVRQAADLQGLSPGVVVRFALVVDRTTSHAERIQVVHYQNTEQDPFSASRLKLLSDLASANARPTTALAIGQSVPDFTLIDQKRRSVSLSQFKGKVVVANFVYTTCALPNFCLRLSNNLSVLQTRFAKSLGRDLVLLTLFDLVVVYFIWKEYRIVQAHHGQRIT